MNLKRRLPQYLIGLIVMASGVVFIKKAEIGISPLSAIPVALSNLTPFTLGNMTILFHTFCMLMTFMVQRRVSLKAVLLLPLAILFGYIIDLLMFIYAMPELSLVIRFIVSFGGIILSGFGIVLIAGADLMLPAPDALLRTISARAGKSLSIIKTVGDITWVAATVLIELVFAGKIISIGIGTVLSMILTGKLVGVFGKLLPKLKMEPTDVWLQRRSKKRQR